MNYYYTHFDRLFDEVAGEFLRKPFVAEEVANSSTVKLPNYPPCDCVISNNKNTLGLRFAMAGYGKDNISVTANETSISVSAESEDWGEGFETIHNGISKKPVQFTIGIDDSYDARGAKTSFKNGMLFLELPIKKEAESVKLM